MRRLRGWHLATAIAAAGVIAVVLARRMARLQRARAEIMARLATVSEGERQAAEVTIEVKTRWLLEYAETVDIIKANGWSEDDVVLVDEVVEHDKMPYPFFLRLVLRDVGWLVVRVVRRGTIVPSHISVPIPGRQGSVRRVEIPPGFGQWKYCRPTPIIDALAAQSAPDEADSGA